MTEAQVEVAARRLCEMMGWDFGRSGYRVRAYNVIRFELDRRKVEQAIRETLEGDK